jgi:hypothetical protein
MHQCGESYKTLCTKNIHMFIYLTILKLQYVLQTYSKCFILYSLLKNEFQNQIKTKFSLLVITLYSMSNM